MKEWWINLGLREKQWLTLGGIFIIFFLFYEIFWSPISSHNDTLRTEIDSNQKLLTWMQQADQHIHAIQDLLQKSHTTKSSAALLSLLQKEINQSPFVNQLGQLSQVENNAVQVTFQKVNFDQFIKWLTALWKKESINVSKISITPSGGMGVVDVTVVVT